MITRARHSKCEAVRRRTLALRDKNDKSSYLIESVNVATGNVVEKRVGDLAGSTGDTNTDGILSV